MKPDMNAEGTDEEPFASPLAFIKPFYSTAYTDRGYPVVIKTVTGHGPLSSDLPEFLSGNPQTKVFSCLFSGVNGGFFDEGAAGHEFTRTGMRPEVSGGEHLKLQGKARVAVPRGVEPLSPG